MMFTRSALATLFLLSISAFAVNAQPDPRLDRVRQYDVEHYSIKLSFDPKQKLVRGDTTLRLRPLKTGLKTLEFDAVAFSFSRVSLEDRDLTFRTIKDKVMVDLPTPSDTERNYEIRFEYTARPKKGIYFIEERRSGDRLVHPAQIWTQGQPDEARHWLPSFDFPSDKASYRNCLCQETDHYWRNGETVAVIENPDGTATHHFRLDIPHPTYLISFVVGDYVKISESFRDIPLGYYVYPGRENIVPFAYGKTIRMLEAMEELTGISFPFNKYDQTMVANFEFGGMENITATTMADTEIFYASIDFMRGNVEDLVAHEIAHSWFGNNTTCKTWADLWLNEGFATFFEAAIREKFYGREEYLRKVGLDAENYVNHTSTTPVSHALYNRRAGDTSVLFRWPAVTYNKGGVVVHQLREQVGDDNFWRAVKLFLERHRFSSVETADLQKVMEEVSGQKLGWFFDQWVFRSGHPKVRVTNRFAPNKKAVTLTFIQTQRVSPLTTAAYKLPLEVELKFADGTSRIEKVDIAARATTVTLKAEKAINEVTFDPATKIPLAVFSGPGIK
ncbi:MAG: M1 family metallopeptidase [Acidobacteria bacterium]|nr:M1 family metallopeptidase [Acidobacteriota bacterium]